MMTGGRVMMKTKVWMLATALALGAIAPGVAAAQNAVQLAAAALPAPSEAVNSLNPVVTVRGAMIMVSDIFSGPIPRGDRAILNSPAPGERTVLDADLLGRIARLYGLDWKPMSREIRAVVKRDSQTLTHEEILDEVRAALEAQGAPKDAELQTSTASLAVDLPVEATPAIEVGKVAFDPRSRRFSAMVDISATEGDRVVFTRQVAVGGRVFATEAMPVLTASVNRGDIIGPNDITVAHVRADQVRDGAVSDPYALVGKQARRAIKEGEPVLASQLQSPVVVNRGDEVVIFYALKTMNLTAKGKAMDAGGQGDVIRILNTSSNRTLMAKVVQPHQVVVDAVNITASR